MKTLKKLIVITSILTVIIIPFQSLASTIPVTPALFESSLSFPEATGDTSFTLTSNALQNGVLPSGYTCFTIDQGQPNTEYECGSVSGTSVTAITRGIDPITGSTSNANLIFSHRRGADVKITDFPTLTILSRIISQQDTIPNALTYAPGINPVSGQDLTTKAYVLSVVNGGPITYNQVLVSGIAGTTISAGQLIYLSTSTGQWNLVSASTPSTFTSVEIGIAQGSATVGNSITNGILIKGVDVHNTGSAGNYAYAQNTAGGIGTSSGANTFVVGQYIASSGGIYFDPYFYTSITALQLAALAGSSGTPSGSNKYITQNSVSATPSANAIPQLDSNGLVPQAMINHAVIASDFSQKTAAAGGVYTLAIPGGTLGTNKGIKFNVLVSSISGTSGDGFTVSASYGGSSLGSLGYAPATTASGAAATYEGYIYANGSTGSQKAHISSVVSTSPGTAASSNGVYTNTTVDSTASQNLVITLSRTNNGGLTAEGVVVTFD